MHIPVCSGQESDARVSVHGESLPELGVWGEKAEASGRERGTAHAARARFYPQVIELEPMYHTVRTPEALAAAAATPTRYLLMVDLLTIETDEPIVSNQAILHELIREAQPKIKERPRLHSSEVV
jgi:hypothetical protein